jgi:hypothetical protein
MFTDPTDVAVLWPIWAPLHRVLLHLAGRMPDDWLAYQRQALAGGDVVYLPDTIAGSVVTLGVSLTAADVAALRRAQEAINGPGQDEVIARVAVVAETPATGHVFAATGPDQRLELLDETALALADRDDVARVGLAWRTGPTPDAPARWIYLVEYDPGAPAWDAVEEVRSLALDAESTPAVEAYWSREELPPYLCDALERAVVLWQRGPDWRHSAEAVLNRLLGAGRAGDLDTVRELVDWPLTGAPRVIRMLRQMPEPDRADWARVWIRGLSTAGDRVQGVERVLGQLMPVLAGASGFRPADPAERRDLLTRFAVDTPPAGVGDDERDALVDLARRADGLDRVFLALADDVELPMAWAPDSDRMVMLFE